MIDGSCFIVICTYFTAFILAFSKYSVEKNLKSGTITYISVPVAQLDRVPDFESVGCRFKSYRAHQASSLLRSKTREEETTPGEPVEGKDDRRLSGKLRSFTHAGDA